jgi:hypothetical protein
VLIKYDKANIMIIKSKKIIYPKFTCDNNNIHEVNLYNYIGVENHHRLNQICSVEKRLMEEGEFILVSRTTIKHHFSIFGKKQSLF